MNIKYGKQISVDEITCTTFDLFICAGNHEERVYTAFDSIAPKVDVQKLLVFCYNENYKIKRKVKNVKKTMITEPKQIYDVLKIEIDNCKESEFNLFIDYSCMTKFWYYSIVLYLTKSELRNKTVNAYFSYTPSKYSPPLKPKPNTEIAPLPGKYIVPTDKPKALIVCLGYEKNKAEGIIEHLDPRIAYIFYTKPTLDPKFEVTLEKNNHEIIAERASTVVTYKFDDILDLERKLTGVYYLLKDKYSIIIAPLGPKPFTFISMMISARFNDVDIWRVGSGSDINEYKRKPIENSEIIMKVVFSKDTIPIASL